MPPSRISTTIALLAVKGDGARVSTTMALVAANWGPDLRWCEVFMEERFPIDISYQTEGGGGFRTLQTQVRSGVIQRIAEWTEDLGRWNVGYGIRTLEKLAAVRALHVNALGAANGFRFMDREDYSSAAWSGQTLDAITDTDQALGTGDGTTTAFQVKKTYTYGGESRTKDIIKLVSGTLVVAIDGTPTAAYTVDLNTGIITFTVAPAGAEVLTCGFEFDKPVHFVEDQLKVRHENVGAGTSIVILEELRRPDQV